METSFLLFCVIITVVGGVPTTKDGSGWSTDQKEPEDSSEEELVDDLSHGLLNHRISANNKNSIDYDEKQASFSTSFSFMYGSIPEASISEYDGYANDRPPDIHDVTTGASETSSRQPPEVDTVQGDDAGRTTDHGSKSVDSNNGLLNDSKEDEGNRDITVESKGGKQNAAEEKKKLKLNKLGYGLMISFGALLIVILVGILSGTLIRMIRKLRA